MTRLDEFSKDEWRDVVRALRPDWSDDQFEAKWREFAAMKRAREWN